ncbi:hypothetical protein LguiA_023377 [Lonicera macranthoides]
MYAMWIFLREKVSCSTKLTDVIHHSERPIKRRSCNFEDDSEGKFTHGVEKPIQEPILGHNTTRNWFYELEIGNPSRNIIEMIFRAASTPPLRHYKKKIKRVLRVNNSMEALERFENYREYVKNKPYEQYRRNPRSMVDGNELLQFYSTTMTCCRGKQYRVSKLCEDASCRVCRIIHSGFNTGYRRKTGIQLSTSSERSNDENTIIGITNGKNEKKAIIVCRVIAGRIANRIDGEYEGEYDSIGSGMKSKLEYLIVKNPCAVLPCFVIVLNKNNAFM